MTASSLESEMAILGILLWDEAAFERLDTGLSPHHFFEPAHSRMFNMIKSRASKEKPEATDPAIMNDLLREDKAYFELGGIKYLADLVDRAPPSANLNDYAAIIISSWQARELADVMGAVQGFSDPADMIATLKDHIERIDAASPSDDDMQSEAEIAGEFIDHLSERVRDGLGMGLQTGIDCIDEKMGGLCPGDLVILAGRPSMGKSSVARNIIDGAARLNREYGFGFASLEMTKFQLSARSLSAAAFAGGKKLPYNLAKKPSDAIVADLSYYKTDMLHNLEVADRPAMTLAGIERFIRKIKKKFGKIGGLVIDYLQIMGIDDNESRNLAIGKVTMGLKVLAKKYGIAIVLLSQLSRKVDERDNNRPQLMDLKDSGSIESDADVVIFVYRKHYYLKRKPPKKADEILNWEDECEKCKNELTLIFDKIRGSEVGDHNLWAALQYDVIRNSDPAHMAEGLF